MVKIEINNEIFEKIEKRAKEKGFETQEYVEMILKKVIDKLEERKKEIAYSNEEEEKVKERLRRLGYLD